MVLVSCGAVGLLPETARSSNPSPPTFVTLTSTPTAVTEPGSFTLTANGDGGGSPFWVNIIDEHTGVTLTSCARPGGRMTVAGAAALAWRARRPLAHLVVAVLVVGWLAIGVLLAPIGIVSPGPGPLSAAPAPTGDVAGIPAVYLPIYRAAADRHRVSWALLAAIHRKESDFSRLRAPSTRGDAVSNGWNGCGAAGPAVRHRRSGALPRHRDRVPGLADRRRVRDMGALPRRRPRP